MGVHSKLILSGAFLMALSGCSSLDFLSGDKDQEGVSQDGLEQVEEEAYVDPERLQGTPFDRALYHGYMGLAKKEDFEHDLQDREAFIDRAMRAGKGLLVAPEALDARDLPADTIPELREARSRLEEAFYAGASVQMPELAAEAQVKFDCWMEQQEEDIQPHDIKECKLAFYDNLGTIEVGGEPAIEGEDYYDTPVYTHSHEFSHTHGPDSNVGHTHRPEEMPKEQDVIVEQKVLVYKGPYIIYFDLDKSFIRPDADKILDQVAEDAEGLNPVRVVITGHTDTSGNKAHNEALSLRRVNATENALRARGIEVSIIQESYYGEQQPRINTGDGVRQQGNRRVEIDFEW